MTKRQMKDLIADAITPHKICRVFFKYDMNYRYYFPVLVSETLFCGAEEDDFILDGYSIRRFRDITKAEIKDDKCLQIDNAEGITDTVTVPKVDITNWKTALQSLQKLGKNIIIEQESLDDKDCQFAIGRVMRVLGKKVLFKNFDADGVWQDELWEIPFTEITSITFSSRYVDVFSKYLPPID